jgi:hypothetical protein
LKRYLDGGGLVIFDAAGGSVEAAASFEALLAGLYPNAKLTPLPADHPIYAAQGKGGKPIQFVTYRRAAYSRLPKDAAQVPRLRGLTLNGRLAVAVPGRDSAVIRSFAADGAPRGSSPAHGIVRAITPHLVIVQRGRVLVAGHTTLLTVPRRAAISDLQLG